jgi:hypothetical protein
MNTYDHYEEAKAVAASLAVEGFLDQAKQINDAMMEGRTGTEIFMILRFRLKPLLHVGGLSDATRQRLQFLYSKLDEALQ